MVTPAINDVVMKDTAIRFSTFSINKEKYCKDNPLFISILEDIIFHVLCIMIVTSFIYDNLTLCETMGGFLKSGSPLLFLLARTIL